MSAENRNAVTSPARYRCEYCQTLLNFSADSFSVEHIHGLTPIGRATVEKLQLNRSGVLNLQRVLRDAGEFPPRD